jgi:hypothetical protein
LQIIAIPPYLPALAHGEQGRMHLLAPAIATQQPELATAGSVCQLRSFAGTFCCKSICQPPFGQLRFFTHVDNQSPIKRQMRSFSAPPNLDLRRPPPAVTSFGIVRELQQSSTEIQVLAAPISRP